MMHGAALPKLAPTTGVISEGYCSVFKKKKKKQQAVRSKMKLNYSIAELQGEGS